MSRTVIVPVHNEAAVLRRTLGSILDGLPDDIDVIVVCNGCTDDSAAIAREFADRIRVHELDEASKTAAINVGLAEAGGPCTLVDADIGIGGDDLVRLFGDLDRADVDLAEPHVEFETSESSFPVVWYYRVWTALHGREPGDVGGGVLCLSTSGRVAIDPIPAVVADDAYVRWVIGPSATIRSAARSVVIAPADVASLVAIKSRSRLGVLELRSRFPDLAARRRDEHTTLGAKARALPPSVWLGVPIYVAVQLAARRRAKRRWERGDLRWDRDHSSRRPA